MKILLAGMNNADNQFGRAIARYGCQVIHTSADPGRFPTDCDATVIVKCQISHKKFEDVKNTYKRLNKPIFVASFGFTQIKEEFEGFVARMAPPAPPVLKVPEVVRRPVVGFTNAPVITTVRAPVPPPAKTPKKCLPHEVTEKIKKIIIDCHLRGEGNSAMVAEMAKAGLKKATGEALDANYVAGYKHWLIKEGMMPIKSVEPVAPVKEVFLASKWKDLQSKRSVSSEEVAVPTQEMSDIAAGRQLVLIGKVLGSGLPQERVLRLIKRIQAGEILSEESVTATPAKTEHGTILQITRTSIFSEKETPLLTLSRVQALAIAQVQNQIEDFATGED